MRAVSECLSNKRSLRCRKSFLVPELKSVWETGNWPNFEDESRKKRILCKEARKVCAFLCAHSPALTKAREIESNHTVSQMSLRCLADVLDKRLFCGYPLSRKWQQAIVI